jgi:hypothetical protein
VEVCFHNHDPQTWIAQILPTLLNIAGKNLEKILSHRLKHVLETNNLIPKEQFRFRSRTENPPPPGPRTSRTQGPETHRTQGPETHRTQDTFSSRFSFQLLSFSNCLSAFPFSCFPSDITAQETPSRKKKKTQREKETNFFCQCRYLLTYFTLFPSDSNSINSLGLLALFFFLRRLLGPTHFIPW